MDAQNFSFDDHGGLRLLLQEAEQWRTEWSHYCSACVGWGGVAYDCLDIGFDTREPRFDTCVAIPATQCHRCGEQGLEENRDGPCKYCGWNYDDGMPEHPAIRDLRELWHQADPEERRQIFISLKPMLLAHLRASCVASRHAKRLLNQLEQA